ncbi:MAG: glutathione S-transferase family protein [Pseudomonadota bacterium]
MDNDTGKQMNDLTLFSMPSSGNSYKARLLLSFLGLNYRHVGMEYETPELASAHAEGRLPLKKLPVLELGDGTRIPESNAILCYLADNSDWLPDDRVLRAKVLSWMFWEQNQHEGTVAVRAALLTYPHRKHLATSERLADLLDAGHERLRQMEDRLSGDHWIATDSATIADIALYAYTHSAGSKGGFDLSQFPGITAWLSRFAALPGYVGLDDIPE